MLFPQQKPAGQELLALQLIVVLYAVPVGMPEEEIFELRLFEVVEVGDTEDDTNFSQVPGADNVALQEVQ